MGNCQSAEKYYSAPCSRCIQTRIFARADATHMLSTRTENVRMFARYKLHKESTLQERLTLEANGFKMLFSNDRFQPYYACDMCVRQSGIPYTSWLYSKTGFLRM